MRGVVTSAINGCLDFQSFLPYSLSLDVNLLFGYSEISKKIVKFCMSLTFYPCFTFFPR